MARSITLAVASMVVLALGCAKKATPEEEIRKVLDEGAAALEARDASAAAETLDDGYLDDKGRDKTKLKQLAFFALNGGPVLVSMQNVVINVDGDSADVKMTALAVQGSQQLKTAKDLLPTNASSFNLDIKMKKSDGKWKVARIDGIRGPSLE